MDLITIIGDIRCEIYYDRVADATYRRRRDKLGRVIWERQTDFHEWFSGVVQIPGIGEELEKGRDSLLTESIFRKIAEKTEACPLWKMLLPRIPTELITITREYFMAICPWRITPLRYIITDACGIRFYVGRMVRDTTRGFRNVTYGEVYTGILAYGKPLTVVREIVRDQPLWKIVGKTHGVKFLCATKQMILNIRRKELSNPKC